MEIGSLTDNCGIRELFEANMEQAVTKTRAEIGSMTAVQPKGVTPELLSQIWKIPFKMAEETLRVTSQINRHGENTSLARNLGTNDHMLRYRRIKSQFFTDTFFVTAEAKSTRGYTHMQIFVSNKGYVKFYPMKSLTEYPSALQQFV